jgi:hypothetical protein
MHPARRGMVPLNLRHRPPHCQRASARNSGRLAAGQGRGPSRGTATAHARRDAGPIQVDGPREGALEGPHTNRPGGGGPMSPGDSDPEGASAPAKGAIREDRPGHP